MNAPTVPPALEGVAVERARVRLRRALRCDRTYAHRCTAAGVRLMRYAAFVGYVDLVALGRADEARAIVAAEGRS